MIRLNYRNLAVTATAGLGAGVVSVPLLMELQSFHRYNQLSAGLPLFRTNFLSKPLVETWNIPGFLQGPFILFFLVPLRLFVCLLPQIATSIWYWRSKSGTRADLYCAPMILICLLCSTFLHSSGFAGTNDDMGWRALLPMQLLLTIWTARSLDSELFWQNKLVSRPVVVLLVLGALAFPTEYYLLRHYTMSTKPVTMDSERVYYARELYSKLNAVLDKNARVAANVDNDLFREHVLTVFYSHRQQLAGDRRRSVVFGGTDQAYDDVVNATNRVLKNGTEQDTEVLFNRFKLGALMVADTDPVWSKPDSWLIKQKPIFENAHFKAYTVEVLRR